jgi:hypothetical protein
MGGTCSCEALCGEDAKMSQNVFQMDLRSPESIDLSKNSDREDSPIASEYALSSVIAQQFAPEQPPISREPSLSIASKKSTKRSQKSSGSASKARTGVYWGLKRPDKSMEISFLMDDKEAEDVLLEGELIRVRPGVTQPFTSRWVQLTKSEFRYFKNQWNANCWLNKPLFTLPLTHLLEIRK